MNGLLQQARSKTFALKYFWQSFKDTFKELELELEAEFGELVVDKGVVFCEYMTAEVCSPRAAAWAATFALSNGKESSSLHAFFKKTVMLSEAGLLDTADSFEDDALPLLFLDGISILCFVLLGYGGQPEPTTTTRTHPKDRTRSLVNEAKNEDTDKTVLPRIAFPGSANQKP